MNILIVCPYFPPENVIGASRVGKFAQHLADDGASVRVITRRAVDGGLSPVDSDGRDLQVLRSGDPLEGLKARFAARGHHRLGSREKTNAGSAGKRSVRSRMIEALALMVRWGLFVPDPFVYWAAGAIRLRLGSWKPDVILASGGPMSSFLVAGAFASRYKVPWVADYRDLLSTGPYYERGWLRGTFDRWIERRVVGSAAALTTVSEPLADQLRTLFKKRVAVVLNGFDPEDFAEIPPTGDPSADLIVTYCGELYFGKRDPSNLFLAVDALSHEGISVVVHFYGGSSDHFENLAKRLGIENRVISHPRVTRAESLRVQGQSDVLLQLMWNDPREVGVYTGKLFEYIGARRPILLMGYPSGVAARLVRNRALGVVANEPDDIASALRGWAEEKRRNGTVAALPSSKQLGLTRREQSTVMHKVLLDLADSRSSTYALD